MIAELFTPVLLIAGEVFYLASTPWGFAVSLWLMVSAAAIGLIHAVLGGRS